MNGVMGVVFFVYNAAFSTILLIIVLVASFIALTSKNPDTRYQPMRDDRGSFIKSQSNINTELDQLGQAARLESKHGYTNNKGARIEDDDESWSGSDRQQTAYPKDAGSERHVPPMYQHPQHNREGSTTSQSQSRFRNQGASPSPWQRGAGYD